MKDIRARAIALAIDHLARKVEAGSMDMEEYLDHIEGLWTDAKSAGVVPQVDALIIKMVMDDAAGEPASAGVNPVVN